MHLLQRYHQKLPPEAPVLDSSKVVYGLAEPEAYAYPKEHALWTPATYDSFNISKGVDIKDKSSSDKNVPPPKEIPIPQGNASPGSLSGCVLS